VTITILLFLGGIINWKWATKNKGTRRPDLDKGIFFSLGGVINWKGAIGSNANG